jgi:excisionase family DNA binding protein
MSKRKARVWEAHRPSARANGQQGTRFCTVSEVAEQTKYSSNYIRQLLRQGDVSGVKIGNMWLTSVEAVETYLTKR